MKTETIAGSLYITGEVDPLFARQILIDDKCLDFWLREWAGAKDGEALNLREVEITVKLIKR